MLISSSVLLLAEASSADKSFFTFLGRATFVLALGYVLVMAIGAWRRRDRHRH